MDDSFMEEMNLISKNIKLSRDVSRESQHMGRNVLTRSSMSDEPFTGFPKASTPDSHENVSKYQSPVLHSLEEEREPAAKKFQPDRKSSESKTGIFVKSKSLDIKQRTPENRARINDAKAAKGKPLNNKTQSKNQQDRSNNSKEFGFSSDVSTEEINKPIDSARNKENYIDFVKNQARVSGSSPRKSSSSVGINSSVSLFTAIQDCVKSESAKIIRSITELHIDSQANLIKQNLFQTDDIVKELLPERDTSQLRSIVRENELLKQNIIILQMRNEELRKVADDAVLLREENVALKLKIKELSK